ncbi:uncharacterized protein N7483_010088 [Penicillium malachiteum]|uniref:uncharacterized protein n=1 Tax=Penicillium malachiteum TaxID=1324776 RepID=UPI0025467B53|nr:uncharacterized protein N7483_010088 [Penicillium malachiteum]KAJ5712907.1 hypothetical protein N7483_010088 [Penicillium malachiteum]
MASGNDILSTSERNLMKDVTEDIGPLQRYRYRLTYDTTDAQYKLINAEQELRELVQKEESLTKDLDQQMRYTFRVEEIKVIESQLDDLNQQYFVLRQKWLRCRNEFTEYLSRAFDLWRSYPNWYLHPVLQRDCALKGGCCGRSCGCCLKRATASSSDHKLGIGHCSVECACCIQSRPFELIDARKAESRSLAQVSSSTYRYDDQILRASIWGLVKDNEENPLDLIKRPPVHWDI